MKTLRAEDFGDEGPPRSEELHCETKCHQSQLHLCNNTWGRREGRRKKRFVIFLTTLKRWYLTEGIVDPCSAYVGRAVVQHSTNQPWEEDDEQDEKKKKMKSSKSQQHNSQQHNSSQLIRTLSYTSACCCPKCFLSSDLHLLVVMSSCSVITFGIERIGAKSTPTIRLCTGMSRTSWALKEENKRNERCSKKDISSSEKMNKRYCEQSYIYGRLATILQAQHKDRDMHALRSESHISCLVGWAWRLHGNGSLVPVRYDENWWRKERVTKKPRMKAINEIKLKSNVFLFSSRQQRFLSILLQDDRTYQAGSFQTWSSCPSQLWRRAEKREEKMRRKRCEPTKLSSNPRSRRNFPCAGDHSLSRCFLVCFHRYLIRSEIDHAKTKSSSCFLNNIYASTPK